jgi:hypothetical protein
VRQYRQKKRATAPGDYAAQLKLARWCQEKGLEQEAAEELDRAAATQDPGVLAGVTRVALHLGQVKMAVDAAKRAAQGGSDDPVVVRVKERADAGVSLRRRLLQQRMVVKGCEADVEKYEDKKQKAADAGRSTAMYDQMLGRARERLSEAKSEAAEYRTQLDAWCETALEGEEASE